MQNFKLVLSYDGSRYNGWQRQGNTDNTIQAKLEALLSRVLEQPVELAASGRTDAGVHAREQVCSFHAKTDISCEDLLSLIRRFLPEDIGAVSLEQAPERFHARLNCTEKTYIYSIWNSDKPNIFKRKYMLLHPDALDVKSMRDAAELLCGQHDFSAFCSNKHMKKSAVRNLKSIEIIREGEELRLIFTGDGFLYNMVRILTGTLLEVGEGRRNAAEMTDIINSKTRERAGATAAACGLCLWSEKY